MKQKTLALFMLLMVYGHTVFAKTNITINSTTKELVGPQATSYQWYKNGVAIIGAFCSTLKVNGSGEYSLQTTDVDGKMHTEKITIKIDACGAIIRIFTIGDSTVQTYAAGYYPRMGWGQVLQKFFKAAEVTVINKGAGGTSSKSFYNNLWPAIRDQLVAGDYVLIQFGINDRNSADPNRYAPTGGVFEGYLTKFVNEARAKGAIPVLVSTIRRNSWKADGTVYDAYHDHPVAVRTVAASLNVPLIDLDARAKVLLQSVGQTYSTNYWYNHYAPGEYPNYPNGASDDVHFQEMGAIEMAKLIVDGINALSNDTRVSGLIGHLNNQHRVTTSANFPAAGLFTRNTTYPPGVKVTLKGRPNTGHSFVKWADGGGATATTNKIFSFTMGNTSLVYKAFFDNNNASLAKPLTDMMEKEEAGVNVLYPNPFHTQTTIKVPGIFMYKILSANGALLETGQGNNTATIGRTIGAGTFTVLIQEKGKPVQSRKIVKE